MPHSLRAKLKNLQRKGELTDKDIDRIFKALEQEPSGETVSLEAFKQVVWERNIAIDQLHELGYDFGQKIEPSDDAISRQAVIDGINRYFHDKYYQRTSIQDCRDCLIEDVIKQLPSVNPQEPKTGHWILKRTFPTKLYDEYLNEYKCSECYREIRCTESQLVNYPYCHCGARMVELQESEDKE